VRYWVAFDYLMPRAEDEGGESFEHCKNAQAEISNIPLFCKELLI
jgi:hypothetical protein